MGFARQTLRPDAIVRPDGCLEAGLEVEVVDGFIAAIRKWSSSEREEAGCLLSPAFVNVHSHLEYYDLCGALEGFSYWDWIRELTTRKPMRTIESVQRSAELAAVRNIQTGIAAIGETSDWPVSGTAIRKAGLTGRIFQEVITLREWSSPSERVNLRREWANKQAQESGLPVHLSPHAPYSVAPGVLKDIARTKEPQSIHVAESEHEIEAFLYGTGPIAEMMRDAGVDFLPVRKTPLEYLNQLGCLHDRTQIVHGCYFTNKDIELAAQVGVSIAHCPRSNMNLGCQNARIAEMRRRGIKVGLGLDSAASSGDIDMFAEMRAAMKVAENLNDPLSASDVWLMATTEGAESLWLSEDWRIEVGANPRLMLLMDVDSLETAIANGAEVRLL